MEAEHSSKADSETAQDEAGGEGAFIAGKLGRMVQWDILYPIHVENWGEEDADEFCPLYEVGGVEKQDEATIAGAYGPLGYTLMPKHMAEIDAKIGLEPRTEEEQAEAEAKEAEKAEQAFEQQKELGAAKLAGKGEKPPGKGKPPGKPKPKPATFAFEDYDRPGGPWHDADIIAARALLSARMPSKAAYDRWLKGTETADNRRVLLDYLADDARAQLTAEGRQLLRELATFGDTAAFASPFEAVSRWRDGMARTLRQFYLAGALALAGPDALDETGRRALQEQNEIQVGYLDGFAGDVLSHKQAMDGTLGARAGMYGQSVRVVAQAVEREKMIAAGMTLEKRVHVGDPSDICPECKAEQAKKWQPIGTLKPIGACLCRTGCHCHFEYKGGGR
jgi:hypothetical protein